MSEIPQLYPPDLVAELAEYLAQEDGYVVVTVGTRQGFEPHAEAILDKVREWLWKDCPDRINNAHRQHVSYVSHLLTGGEPNQLGATIEKWGKVGEFKAFPARQLTGTPKVWHAYVGRDKPEVTCCGTDHRSATKAEECAAQRAGRLNRRRH